MRKPPGYVKINNLPIRDLKTASCILIKSRISEWELSDGLFTSKLEKEIRDTRDDLITCHSTETKRFIRDNDKRSSLKCSIIFLNHSAIPMRMKRQSRKACS
jgi:hypothetical protein